MTDAPAPLARRVPLAGGATMPLVGLGTSQLLGDEAVEAVGWALETGYRLVDTATAYRNEAAVGRALSASGLPRGEVFVTTKLPPENAGRERSTLERSLAELGTEYVDLWLIHWPPGDAAGVSSWEQLVQARADGLARAIGVSNYSLAQVDELTAATGVTPEVNQVPLAPATYDADLAAGHRERGVALEGYGPLRAGGLGSPVIRQIAEHHDVGPAQVLVRWHLQHEVVVIPKSGRRDRIESNVDVGGFALSDDEMRAIDALGG